ncbi:MAG: chorismate-binding protein [Marinifilum sp.]|jgi:isochorismate synthase|nr:chorismate-binding protein [Marinifilum sp.]
MRHIEGEDVDVHDFLNTCLEKEIAFYVFAKPNSGKLEFGAQLSEKSEVINELTECFGKQGFVFSPFQQNCRFNSHFIRRELSEINSKSLRLIKEKSDLEILDDPKVHVSTREEYELQITRMINDLQDNKLEKVILSRIEILENRGRKNAVAAFLNLNKTYPKAFVFMVDIPDVGLWIGATPERLMRKNQLITETMALAGTQKLDGRKLSEINWDKKEIEEQAFVTDYIDSVFKKYKIKNVEKNGPVTALAGNIVHLKTHFKAYLNLEGNELSNFIKDLHPTPAVCGLPKKSALELIDEVENHDREYYGGYLGPVEEDGDLSLFVNLRSMKVLQNKMALFVGGGITVDSNPEKEWMETCFKAQTLLNVIK